MKPRDYQVEANAAIWDYFRQKDGNPVCAMPTGTGKSVVIAMFLQSAFAAFPNQRWMMLTHVQELIEQNHDKLRSIWPSAPCGIYSAGLNKREYMQQITFAGIASVAKKVELFGHQDMILVDECHLVSQNEETMYRRFFDQMKRINKHIKAVGFTATPWRLGHGRITQEGGLFNDICFDITGLGAFNRLIAEGYLVPLVPKPMKTVLETDGLHMRGGEFVQGELEFAVNKDEITYAALKETMDVAHDRRSWLIFAAGVKHATRVAEMLTSLGIECRAVTDKTSKADRKEILRQFKNGQLRAVVNNNVLTTGFDHPGLDLIVVLRPTASPILWVQMLGRGTRPLFTPGFDMETIEGRLASIQASPKQNCLVLDFARNTKRLGPINDPVVPHKKGEGKGEAPVKECEKCGTYNHAAVRFCDYCGHEFPLPTTKLQTTASSQELIKGDLPVIETFKVDHITYERHDKIGAPSSLRVTYYSGARRFREFVCLEHTGFAQRKAQQWWKERRRIDSSVFPPTIDDALLVIEHLKAPTHLRIWVNKPYPEIMAACFDGTAFGTQGVSSSPTVQATKSEPDPAEDDIPF